MANEISASVSLTYEDSENTGPVTLAVLSLLKTAATKKITRLKQNIGTVEEAIQLGEITAPGYAIFVNRDPTNYIELRVATAGAKFATLDPDTNGDGNGGFACLKLGTGAQVPYAIANTAACQMDVFIISV